MNFKNAASWCQLRNKSWKTTFCASECRLSGEVEYGVHNVKCLGWSGEVIWPEISQATFTIA